MKKILWSILFVVLFSFVSAGSQIISNENSVLGISSPSLSSATKIDKTIEIISPSDLPEWHNKNMMNLTIEVDEKCNLGYMDYTFKLGDLYLLEEDPSFNPTDSQYKSLCESCDTYNKPKLFKDGAHYLNIKCLDKPEINSSILFAVDSKPPVIFGTYPKKNSFTNGSDFMIKYNEEQPILFVLNVTSSFFMKYGPFYDVNEDLRCFPGNQKCYFNVDLSKYDGEEISYNFFMSDMGLNRVFSKLVKVKVDTTAPILNNFDYTIDGRRVKFIFDITELNFDKINYVDSLERNPRERVLCSRLKNGICEVSKNFSKGEHNLTIRILDKAGNSDSKTISFNVA